MNNTIASTNTDLFCRAGLRGFLLLGIVSLVGIHAGAAEIAVPDVPVTTLPIRFEVVEAVAKPVIDVGHSDLADNKYGFEGGTVVKIDGVYHMFATEMAGDPFWVKMRIAHWTSPNGIEWKRVSTIKETSGKSRAETGLPYESFWSPMLIFNEADKRWEFFHVAYDIGAPATGGRIWRATSTVQGRTGIAGPYKDFGIIMQPDAESPSWEGPIGVDSFFPYQVKDGWYALYGGQIQRWPCVVAMAKSDTLTGPWKRCATGNPLPIEKVFIENPIVSRIGDQYVAIYDATTVGAGGYEEANGHVVGYSCSADGINWLPGGRITVQGNGEENWSKDIRTPLCLIDEGKGIYTMLYTGEDKNRRFFPVGMVKLKLVTEKR